MDCITPVIGGPEPPARLLGGERDQPGQPGQRDAVASPNAATGENPVDVPATPASPVSERDQQR